MKGNFIANEVISDARNVYWDWNDCTPVLTPQAITAMLNPAQMEEIIPEENLETSEVIESLGTTEIDLLKGVKMNIFPNPSTGIFNVKFEGLLEGDVSINVLSINGKLLHSERLNACNNCQNTIDLNRLPNGMYLVQVFTEEGKFYSRIAITH